MPRVRELGICPGFLPPGTNNAITDVPGVLVGHVTLITGDGMLSVGSGPVRTGVTIVRWHDGPLFGRTVPAGVHRLNGNGELTGAEWIRESGQLVSPIALTNTHSLGTVRDALIAAAVNESSASADAWMLPVVAETWDGWLNDVNGQHVQADHVLQALSNAKGGRVSEGSVGGGTGMICHGFKGGIGTASRRLDGPLSGCHLGVLVQANHGRRERLCIEGRPIGRTLKTPIAGLPSLAGAGSVIVIVATDAPLLPHQCTRLAQRPGLGLARLGATGEHWSGDLFLAFSVANSTPNDPQSQPTVRKLSAVEDGAMDLLFDAVIEATEEAVLNALLSAETMTGRDGNTAHALDTNELIDALAKARWQPAP